MQVPIRGHLGRLINKSASSRVAISGYALYPPEIMIPNLTHNLLSFIYLHIGGKGFISFCSTTTTSNLMEKTAVSRLGLILGSLDAFLDSLLNTVPPPLFFIPFSITEKMVMSCFSPTTTCMMHPSALTSRIWLPTRTAPVGPAPLYHWDPPPMDQAEEEEDCCGWGVAFRSTVFVAAACVCVVCTCINTPSLYNVNFWSGPNCSIFDKMDRKKRLYLDLADQFESFDLFPDRWTLALADRRKLVCVLGAILGCFPDLFTESTIDHFDSLIGCVLCEYCSFAVPGDKHCFPVVEPSNENFN